jgi:hypothetical protein
MLLWESTDSTVRMLCRQVIQGGEVSSAFQKAPSDRRDPVHVQPGDPRRRRAALQDLGRWAHPCLTRSSVRSLRGEEFRVRAGGPSMRWMRFAHVAQVAADSNDLEQPGDAMYDLCEAALHPDEDWDRFLDVADRDEADEEELMACSSARS